MQVKIDRPGITVKKLKKKTSRKRNIVLPLNENISSLIKTSNRLSLKQVIEYQNSDCRSKTNEQNYIKTKISMISSITING